SEVKMGGASRASQRGVVGGGAAPGGGGARNTADITPGSTVAVLGCGGVGQAVTQGARIAGASRIIAIDPQPLKREMAQKLGASDVGDPGKGDPTAQGKELTGGRGAAIAFQRAGPPES